MYVCKLLIAKKEKRNKIQKTIFDICTKTDLSLESRVNNQMSMLCSLIPTLMKIIYIGILKCILSFMFTARISGRSTIEDDEHAQVGFASLRILHRRITWNNICNIKNTTFLLSRCFPGKISIKIFLNLNESEILPKLPNFLIFFQTQWLIVSLKQQIVKKLPI